MTPAVTERAATPRPRDGRASEGEAEAARPGPESPEALEGPARAAGPPALSTTRTARRVRLFSLVALAIIGSTAALPLLTDRTRSVTPARALGTLPHTLGAWVEGPAPPGDAMPLDPDVVHHLFRTYRRGADTAWISVGFYPALAPGRHPPAQKLILPGRGYADLSTRVVDIPLGSGRLAANVLVIRAADRHVSTLYWYHVGGHDVASDHGYRARLLFDRLWRHRSDVGLIRVVSRIPQGEVEPVIAAQMDFVRALYPELRRILPE